MARIEGRRAGIVALLLAVSPAAAAAREQPRHPPARRLVVHPRPAALPLGVAVAPGLAFATPFAVVAGAGAPDRVVRVPHYIGPDGAYDDYADLIRSINGTPCGQACTRRSLVRWGYAPAD